MKPNQCKTYAHATACSNEVIVVKPKERQGSDKTKSELKEKIDPKNLAIAVENVKEGKDGAVIINCCNADTKNKIKEKVENELGNKYSVADGVQRNPKVINRGVEEDILNENDNVIIDCLKDQNQLEFGEASTLEVYSKYKQKDKRNKGNIILVTDFAMKEQLCCMGKVNIGWRRCVIHEHFSILRCYHCGRYGHKASNCDKDLSCFKCGGAHKSLDCSEGKLKCSNCEETNKKLRKSLDTNHAVNDPNCPCYQRILQLEASKTKQS